MFYVIGYKEVGKPYFHIALTQDYEEKFKKDFFEENRFKGLDLKNVKMDILYETQYRDAAQICKNISLYTWKDHVDFKGNIITKKNAAIQYMQIEQCIARGQVKKFESNEVQIQDWIDNNTEDKDFFDLLSENQKKLAKHKAIEHQTQADMIEQVIVLLDMALSEGVKTGALEAAEEIKKIKAPYEKDLTLQKSRVWFWTNGKKLAQYFKVV